MLRSTDYQLMHLNPLIYACNFDGFHYINEILIMNSFDSLEIENNNWHLKYLALIYTLQMQMILFEGENVLGDAFPLMLQIMISYVYFNLYFE